MEKPVGTLMQGKAPPPVHAQRYVAHGRRFVCAEVVEECLMVLISRLYDTSGPQVFLVFVVIVNTYS